MFSRCFNGLSLKFIQVFALFDARIAIYIQYSKKPGKSLMANPFMMDGSGILLVRFCTIGR
jgi:hypothetical protein